MAKRGAIGGNGSDEMARNRWAKLYPEEAVPSKHDTREETGLACWLFQHQDLIRALEIAERVTQQTLTNTLNRIHFVDGSIFVHLRHPKYEESILVRAFPEPCFSGELTCQWSDSKPSGFDLLKYQFQHLIIADGKSIIVVPGKVQRMDGEALSIQLPDTGYAMGQRRARRHSCKEVSAELSQNGFYARGALLDFSPLGLRMVVRPASDSSFHWLNSDEPVTILLRQGNQILFSGSCAYIREQGSFHDRELVFSPMDKVIRRFKRKQIRNPRLQLIPSPSVSFVHPFLGKTFHLEVGDISTSGCSVYENPDEGVLIPGMIIPELAIHFAGEVRMNCTAQVIYSYEAKAERVRCGLAILDMNINAYSLLTHLLTKALDPHAYLANAFNMDALWEFFFDTGFIYPTKYRLIQSYRKDFKETYRRLYKRNPEIAKHFTYQKNGRIYGHVSMVRAYQRAWLIHHYAAMSMEKKRTGFMVLKQMMHYLNDMCRLPSAKMDYVMCYFRPENRFPKLVFGGFTKFLGDPRGCSMDQFAYLPYTSLSLGTELPKGWSLKEFSDEDFWELRSFYNHCSGGLLLDALGLGQKQTGEECLEDVYSRLGFQRRCQTYALTHQGELCAVLIVNQSDLGLNLSELLNGIKILVTNSDSLPWNILSTAIARLTAGFEVEKVPVLFYPVDYVQAKEVPFEKTYHLWTLNVQYGQDYMEYMQEKFRISYE